MRRLLKVGANDIVFRLTRSGTDTSQAIVVGYVITATGSYVNATIGEGTETIQSGQPSADVTIQTTANALADFSR